MKKAGFIAWSQIDNKQEHNINFGLIYIILMKILAEKITVSHRVLRVFNIISVRDAKKTNKQIKSTSKYFKSNKIVKFNGITIY